MTFFHFFSTYIHDSIPLMRMQIVYKKIQKTIVFLLLTCSVILPIAADARQGNLDIFVLIDRSLSMEQEFSEVQEYVQSSIIENLLHEGDYLNLIAFYGEPQNVASGIIGRDFALSDIQGMLYSLEPDRHYTDIGSALDLLEGNLAHFSRGGIQDYVIMLTDGYHEGPPGSPYPGKTYELQHPLLTPVKEISTGDWKIVVLGFTVKEEARRLASEVIAAWQDRN